MVEILTIGAIQVRFLFLFLTLILISVYFLVFFYIFYFLSFKCVLCSANTVLMYV